MKIAPAVIEKPGFSDKASFGFGLISVGKSHRRFAAARETAQKVLTSNRQKAYAVLEKSERLLYWATDRSKQSSTELEATFAMHASMLVEDKKDPEAAAILLRARELSGLTSHPKMLLRLADYLAKTGEQGTDAVDVFIDYLSQSRALGGAVSKDVCRVLADLAIPSPTEALPKPSTEQRRLIQRVNKADPSCGFALFGKALCAFHDGDYAAVTKPASAARKAGESPQLCDYLVKAAKGYMALDDDEYLKALSCFEAAHATHGDHPAALVGIGEAVCLHADDWCARGLPVDSELQGLLSKGIAAVKKAGSPVDSVALSLIGRLSLHLGDLGTAREALGKAATMSRSGAILAALAAVMLAQADVEGAVRVAVEAAESFPSAGAYCTLGDCYTRLREWDKAVEAYSNGLGLHDLDVPCLIGKARALVEGGRSPEAIEFLVSSPAPGNRQCSYWLARAQLRVGRIDDAVEGFKRLCSKPSTVNDYYYGASALATARHYRQADVMLHSAEQLDPKNADIQILYANVCIAAGRLKEAVQHLDLAEKLAPDHPELPYSKACADYASGNAASASEVLEALVKDKPERADYLEALAVLHLRSGDTAIAADYARRSLAADGSANVARSVLVASLARELRWAELREVLIASGQTCEQMDDISLWLLGSACLELGDHDAALLYWETLSSRHPDTQRLSLNVNRLYYMIGSEKVRTGNLDAAVTAWLKFGECRADDEDLWRDIGQLHFRNGLSKLLDADEDVLIHAVDDLSEALRLLGPTAKICFYHGLLELRFGKCEEAVKWLSKSVEMDDPKYSRVARFWLGVAHAKDGRCTEALSALNPLTDDGHPTALVRAAKHVAAVVHAGASSWKEAVAVASSLEGSA